MNPSQLHFGDEFLYSEGEERGRPAILVGLSQDQAVVHFKGYSYIYDICIDRDILSKRATLVHE